MKTGVITKCLTLIMGALSVASAQSQLQFGGGGQITLPLGDYSGSTNDFYLGSKYGAGVGLGFHLKSRFEFAGIPWMACMEYSVLRSKGSGESSQGEIELEQRIFSLRLGPEWFFDVAASFTPYVCAGLILNNIGGDASFKKISTVSDTAFIQQAGERLGVGISGGVLIPIYPESNVDISVSYNVLNPFNKVWVADSRQRRVDSYSAINDAQDPEFAIGNPKHFIQNARSIQTLQLTVTLIFRI